MTRRAARIDRNHRQIVQALRKAGASVWNTHTLGKGFPDICVGFRGRTYLMEIKDEKQPPSKRRLTEDEQLFFDTWVGQVEKVESIKEAFNVLGIKTASSTDEPK